MRKCIRLFLAALVIILLLVCHSFAGGSLLLKNVRLIDGTGASIQEGVSILIRDGQIAKIGKNLSGQGATELDVQGSYVLPGLIDAHVHLMWGPAVALNKYDIPRDSKMWEATWGKYISQYLRAYLACGVTTVMDASAPTFTIKGIREHLAKGNPGPRFLTLGSFFSPPKGYGIASFNPPVSSREEVEAKLNEMQDLGVTGIKVPIEKGWNPVKDLPLHSQETLDAIKQGAAQRKLPVYVHTTTEEAFDAALDMEARALMHTFIHRRKESRKLTKTFIERMARTNTYQVSTLSVMDAEFASHSSERLDEPLIAITVPQSELSTARDPQAIYTVRKLQMEAQAPWFLKPFADTFIDTLYGKDNLGVALKKSQKAIYDLHRGGVKIVMGSDTVYHNYAPYSLHGFTSLREIELLGEAGLSPQEAIKAATVNAAQMIGLDREIGTIEAGKRADLVILKDNPLNNLQAFRTVRWTVKDGIAKTPKEWMTQ